MLGLIDNGSRMSHNELERTLLSLNDEIDKLFTILKESERIMLSERESLAHIAILAEQLKMNLPESDSNSNLVEEISRLSNKRL
jgi:hypothetical protein